MRVIFLISVIVLLAPLPISAWHTNTHLQMTRDAIALMPADFQQLFSQNIQYMQPGIQDPDGVIRDYQNHYYLPFNKEGGAIDRIESIIPIIQTKLKVGNNRDAVKQFCYLAHYVADLWTPEPLIKRDQGPNDDFVANTPIIVLFEGYDQPIKNYKSYFQDRSSWRWTFENSEAVYSLLYSEAVNDIANTWLSVWNGRGRSVQTVSPLMIDHKKDAFRLAYDLVGTNPPEKIRLCGLSQAQKEKVLYEQSLDEQYAAEKAIEQSTDNSEAIAEARGRLALQALLSPRLEISVLENSLTTLGNHSYFVARMRHIGTKSIKYFSVNYRGNGKKLVEVQDFKPGEVVKIKAVLPPNVTKEEIQYRYSEK
jgi:hypothetical protein